MLSYSFITDPIKTTGDGHHKMHMYFLTPIAFLSAIEGNVMSGNAGRALLYLHINYSQVLLLSHQIKFRLQKPLVPLQLVQSFFTFFMNDNMERYGHC